MGDNYLKPFVTTHALKCFIKAKTNLKILIGDNKARAVRKTVEFYSLLIIVKLKKVEN